MKKDSKQAKISSVRPTKRRRVAKDSDSDVGAIQFEPQDVQSDEDEDLSSPRRHILPAASQKRRIVRDSDSDDEDQPQEAPSKPSTSYTKLRKSKTETKGKAKPQKRKLVKGIRPASESEGDDDLEEEHILDNRFRDRGKQTAFQKKLASYQKRRSKPKGAAISISYSDDEDESSSGESNKPFKGARPSSDRDSLFDGASEDESSSEHDSDFIVEDEGTKFELPAQFRGAEDLALSFKKTFQLFVHVAVQPPEERHNFMQDRMEDEDQYFNLAISAVRKKLSGLRDSLVASSIWPSEFRKPLEKYPCFEIVDLQVAVRGCDACKLGNRISTRLARVSGLRYDRYGFEDLEDSSSENDSESESEETRKRSKSKKKTKRKRKVKKRPETDIRNEFSLGRFCARRAIVFHQFSHWEYELFSAILDEVNDLRKSKKGPFIKIGVTGKQPSLKKPDTIQEWLDDRGLIDMQWKHLQDMMDAALNLDAQAKRGVRDEDG